MSIDIQALQDEIDRLYKLAYYDTLTDLPNRLMFHEASERIMKHVKRDHVPFAVFLIDLDNFKPINDIHGHGVGDQVLKIISDRLATLANVRCKIAEEQHENYDSHKCHCLVARLGGDEFVMIVDNTDQSESEIIAEQVIEELHQVIIINGVDVYVSASVGVALYPHDGKDVSTLLKSADIAMYVSKEKGKDQYTFHEASMNLKIEEFVELETMIREIIATKRIDVHFQPIFSLRDGGIRECEALLRGNKSKKRLFNPAKLIEVAEQSNLIVPLGSIILQKACEFGCTCFDAGYDIMISVNVSAHQIASEYFLEDVKDILETTGLPPTNLTLEITENTLMQNFEDSSKMLNQLRSIGVKISIDDFGKGYSSFSYLQKLPINKIKIDMSFIQSLGEDEKTNEIVKGIILMAEAIQMKTCAEGVETAKQCKVLKALGCDYIQGHLKYRALSPVDFLEMLQTEVVSKF